MLLVTKKDRTSRLSQGEMSFRIQLVLLCAILKHSFVPVFVCNVVYLVLFLSM